MTIRAGKLTSTEAPYDIVRKMRASILVLGPLLGARRRGDGVAARRLRDRQPADRPPPQGAGGARRRDRTRRRLCEGDRAGRGLPGGRVTFPIVSVGATENALMAAVTSPRADDHRKCRARAGDRRSLPLLVAMGAEIDGIGTETLEIEGGPPARRDLSVMPDRIEAGSYACAAAITGGALELVGARDATICARPRGARRGRVTSRNAATACVVRRWAAWPLTLSTAPFPASRPTCRRSSWRCWRWPTAPAC
jgi:UDP-N-acetylglucosamine 1-carboxyvinyltransferase